MEGPAGGTQLTSGDIPLTRHPPTGQEEGAWDHSHSSHRVFHVQRMLRAGLCVAGQLSCLHGGERQMGLPSTLFRRMTAKETM